MGGCSATYCVDLGLGVDCWDGSCAATEGECPAQGCNSETEFECTDGECIPAGYACDGNTAWGNGSWGPDCTDGSDEDFNTCCENDSYDSALCIDDAFTCTADSIIIHNSWVCDGWDDCSDGADEDDCDESGCLYVDPTYGMNCDEWLETNNWTCTDLTEYGFNIEAFCVGCENCTSIRTSVHTIEKKYDMMKKIIRLNKKNVPNFKQNTPKLKKRKNTELNKNPQKRPFPIHQVKSKQKQ